MSDIFFLVLRRLRTPLILLIAVYAVATLGMTLIPGVDDNGQPWHMSFFHAFYFVSFMGTTIGFGEIPYAFTDAQRAWVLVCIYTSVIVWLYAIGTMLSLLQNEMFKRAIANRAFKGSIRRIERPFHIICGYGETGELINKGLIELGIQTVIIDNSSDRTNSLALMDLAFAPITLNADVTEPDSLISAGIHHQHCQGVIAVTDNDHTNLQIALNCKLLNEKIPIICRSEIQDEADNMASFGTDEIVNPYQTFAQRLNLFTHKPAQHQIQSWFINQHSNAQTSSRPPKGRWIICGYGRLGKAISDTLNTDGIEIVLVDADPQAQMAPDHTIIGRGTEAKTLLEAGIVDASVVIAASNDDANNLSILMTAGQLNNNIYTIGRVNHDFNETLFIKAKCDHLMRGSQIVANETLTLISRPLVTKFIAQLNTLKQDDLEQLINRINKLTNNSAPVTWRLIVDKKNAPALINHLSQGHKLNIGEITKHKALPKADSLALLLLRDGLGGGNHSQLMPDSNTEIQIGDELLFCNKRYRTILPQRLKDNAELVDSLVNNNPHHIPLLRWRKRLLDRHRS